MIKVFYKLLIGNTSFTKVCKVHSVPAEGTLLKAANFSFKVFEIEQDLDVYISDGVELGQFSDSVKANFNDEWEMPSGSRLKKLFEDLTKAGWEQK
ncbi:MAG TPA: hypothetical protein VLB02_01925 [Candidatus Paceibacterota bacterium]|nr:hypothetical protein [Candidatus Paceibacterota bacterium]